MKLFAMAILLAMVTCHETECAARGPYGSRPITLDARVNCPYLSSNGGTVYLHLTVNTPNIGPVRRRPMNLSVVLDRSGSMGGEKINYAKQALTTLIDQLTGEDILSIVVYDDRIDVLREAGPVRDKWELKRLVESVYARGSTNLGGGMMEGFRQVERNRKREYVNRVVLLSDGLANQGITDPHQLNQIARRYRSSSIVLTTMGVGLDYNENLMVGLAENGGGNYYFIESPNTLASILRKEFNLMSSVVAQSAVIEMTLGSGVHVNDVIGCEYRPDQGRVVLPVGDLYSGESREFTIAMQVPHGTGSLTLASGTLRYEASMSGLNEFPGFSTSIHYTEDAAVMERNRDLPTQAKVDVALSTRKVEQAMKSIDEGRPEEAAKELGEARSMIMASPAAVGAGAASNQVRVQADRLDDFQKLLKDSSNTQRAKKAIQYENYKTQKNKQ
jgi:Ca-activated chloride channel family protein